MLMLSVKSASSFRAWSAAAASSPLRPSTLATATAAPLRPFATSFLKSFSRPNTTGTAAMSATRQRFMSTTPPPRPSTGGAQSMHAQQQQQHPVWIRAFAKFANGKQPGQQGFWLEVAIIFTVFAITGSSSLMVVRKAINQALGVEGSLKDGPNSWRLAYLTFGLPMYSAILLTLGTLSGRGAYFRMITHRMYGRILPKAWADKLKV